MQQEENHVEPYDNTMLSVGDIDTASMLVAKGHELVSVDKINNKKSGFIFRKTRDAEKLIQDYWLDRVDVRALAFATARKNLKSRLFGLETIRY